jgi:hypothetical protein
MNISTQLDLVQSLWDQIEITQLLEKHVPLDRRYLVDQLLRLIFPPEI